MQALPHNWIDGLKRIPLHLVAFSLPAALAIYFLPLPWNVLTVWAFFLWRLWAEMEDYSQGRDTYAKSLIDLVSQTVGIFIGIYVHNIQHPL